MTPQDFLKNLQNKPYDTRVRIMWATVMMAAIILLVIWGYSIKSSVQNIDTKNLINVNPTTKSTSAVTTNNWVSVERVEKSATALKIFFNVFNSTDDILNFPTTDSITLNVDGQTNSPTALTDRQNSIFVQKVLSHTQDFGILVFPATNADAGVLSIDGLSFEKSPDQILKQDLNLNFKELNQPSNSRN